MFDPKVSPGEVKRFAFKFRYIWNDRVETVPDEILGQAINLLGKGELTQEHIEAALEATGIEAQTAHRLALFTPEAFGFILAGHLKEKIAPASTFSVQKQDGKWSQVPFSAEPIFVAAVKAAQAMYHSGPRESFKAIASRSSVMNVINDALNRGASIEGAAMAIAFNGIPAEIYPEAKRTLFEKFFDWRLRKLKKAAQKKTN